MVMSGWRKALGQLHVCVSASSGDNGRYIATDNGVDTPGPPPTASSSNTAALLSPRFSSKLRSSQLQYTRATCAICLELMKPGHGHALFTAECSHTFHFSCIASNVRYGSLVCPVCRSTWKDVPWQAPTLKTSRHDPVSRLSQRRSNSVSPRRRDPSAPTSPTSVANAAASSAPGQPQQRRLEPVLRMLDDSIAQFRSAEERQKQMAESDPPTFDDDEQLENCSASSDGIGNSRSACSTGSSTAQAAMQITAVAEESEVPFFEERERMTILVNVKAAAARDEEKHIASMLGSSGNVLQLDRSSQAQQPRRAAVDLVAVLDVSSSMAGPKLSLLKRAMHLVVRSLDPADRLSVVAFASKPRRVMPLRRMTEEGRRAALEAIESLACTAGTSIAEALRKATAILQHRRYRNPVATIMLLSDGQDATSPTHRNGSLSGGTTAAATTGRSQFQIPVHTFGGDPETPPGSGSVSLIQGDVAAAAGNLNMQDAFARCLGGLLSVVAVRVELEVQVVNPATNRLLDVEGGNHVCQVVAPGRHLRITLGDLYAHEERDLLVNIHLGALRGAAARGETLLVLARYYDPVTGAGLQTATTQVLVHRPVQVVGSVPRPTSIDVERHRNRLQTARAIVQTRFLVDAGDFRAAQRCLENTRHRLQSSVAYRSRDRQSCALDAELARILVGLRGRSCADTSAQARSSSRPRNEPQVVEVNTSGHRSSALQLRSRAQIAAAAAVANVAAGGGSAPQSPRRRHILAPRPGSRLARLASFDSVIRP